MAQDQLALVNEICMLGGYSLGVMEMNRLQENIAFSVIMDYNFQLGDIDME